MQRRSRRLTAALAVAVALGTVVPAGVATATNASTSLEGRLVLGIAENAATGATIDSAFIVNGLDSQEVSLPSGWAEGLVGKHVRVDGRRDGDRVVATDIAATEPATTAVPGAAEGQAGTTADGSAAATTAASVYPGAQSAAGTHRVAIINFNFSNDRRVPFSNAAVRSAAFSATRSMASYYREISGGRISFTGSVFGWYTISARNYGCQMSTWASQARAAATRAGVNLGAYDHIVYSFPSVSGCWWVGHAEIGGRGTWLNGRGTNLQVMSHELGHNLGLWHARTKRCVSRTGARVALSNNCTTSEYGDPFDVMGLTSRHLNTTHRAGLGIVPADGIRIVRTTRTVVIAPASSSTGIRLLRIPRSSAPGTFFDIEFRPNTGLFDRFGTGSTNRGVLVRMNTGLTASTNLLDMTPLTTSFADAALVSGRAWKHGIDRVTIGVGAVTATGIRVSVTFGPDVNAPSAPSAFAAIPYSTSVNLSWAAAWDNVAVTTYRLYRSGSLIASLPGTARAFTDTGRKPLTEYRYTLRAVDAAGNVGPAASITTTTLPPDVNPPTAPTWLTANAGLDSARLSWGAATDKEGPVTGYRVTRDGRVIANLTGATRTYLDNGLAPGTYVYAVAAVDTAGNLGAAATRTVRIVGPDLEPPSAPAGLAATTTQTSVFLSWHAATDNGQVARYVVTRDGRQIASLSSGARGYRDSGLERGTAYRYTVRAVDGAGNVGPPAQVEATTNVDTSGPSAPSWLTATAGENTVRLAWGGASDNTGVSGYRIWRDGQLVTTLDAGARSWLDEDLDPGAYAYAVSAFDAAGNIGPAAEAHATVLPPDTEAPTAPLDLRITDVRRHSVRFAWDPATDDVGVVSYRLYEDGRYVATTIGTVMWHRPSDGISIFTVVAVDAAGNLSPASEPLIVDAGG